MKSTLIILLSLFSTSLFAQSVTPQTEILRCYQKGTPEVLVAAKESSLKVNLDTGSVQLTYRDPQWGYKLLNLECLVKSNENLLGYSFWVSSFREKFTVDHVVELLLVFSKKGTGLPNLSNYALTNINGIESLEFEISRNQLEREIVSDFTLAEKIEQLGENDLLNSQIILWMQHLNKTRARLITIGK